MFVGAIWCKASASGTADLIVGIIERATTDGAVALVVRDIFASIGGIVGIGCFNAAGPLPEVAAEVEEPKGTLADGIAADGRDIADVVVVVGVLIGRLVVAPGITAFVIAPATAFPLGFSGQPTPRPSGIGIGLLPTHTANWIIGIGGIIPALIGGWRTPPRRDTATIVSVGRFGLL